MLGKVRLVRLGSVRFFFHFLRRTVPTANCPTAKNPRALKETDFPSVLEPNCLHLLPKAKENDVKQNANLIICAYR